MLCHIALCSPPFSMLTYAPAPFFPDSFWKPGLRVAVPLGKGIRMGVIIRVLPEEDPETWEKLHIEREPEEQNEDFQEKSNEKGTQKKSLLRSIVWPLEGNPLLTDASIATLARFALRQQQEIGRILALALPQNLRNAARLRLREREGLPSSPSRKKSRILALKDINGLSPEDRERTTRLFLEGILEPIVLAEDKSDNERCLLLCDPPWPVRPAAARQKAALDWLLDHPNATHRQFKKAVSDASVLSALVSNGLISIISDKEEDAENECESALLPPPDAPFRLSEDQEKALTIYARELDRLSQKKIPYAIHLLFGITGSGKTAVYLELARVCLERGKSALILAPEVGIALKLRRDAELRFPGVPLFFHHGYRSPSEKERTFRNLAKRKGPCLIIGTRSALFLPLPELGAIILDEEHDASFKQEERMPYHAKDIAWEWMKTWHCLLLLASATPDIKTFHAAASGVFPMERLRFRVGGGKLPVIQLADIRNLSSSHLLGAEALEALRTTVSEGRQAVVLLNRRGYSPILYCLGCEKTLKCPNCDISLTYHKKREQVVCHYCGFTRPHPMRCPSCGSLNFLPMGGGTEKLEESLLSEELKDALPPGGRVLRMDRDSAARPEKMEEILTAFAREEAQVLVGTQMLSKGHHFPHVTLAVLADGDMGLNMPDYRAAERTFQLLVQTSGRAGRGGDAGRVVIQTRNPEHPCWKFVENADYEGFYRHEIAIREKRRYPPFGKLALIRASWPMEWERGRAALNEFAAALKKYGRKAKLVILGPAPAVLGRLQNRIRFQIMIKGEAWQPMRDVFTRALKDAPPTAHLSLSLDLDPVSMF